jgi:hypothetical protein
MLCHAWNMARLREGFHTRQEGRISNGPTTIFPTSFMALKAIAGRPIDCLNIRECYVSIVSQRPSCQCAAFADEQ